MKRCPYAVLLIEQRWEEQNRLHHARCERRNVLGSSGWHQHRARVPEEVTLVHMNKNTRICWYSTNTPDYVAEDAPPEPSGVHPDADPLIHGRDQP